MHDVPKVIFVIGQTASGKSDFAVELASRLGSVVVCADAFQVYREFSVASDKILPNQMQGVRHFGLDLVDPGTEFTVKSFLELTVPIIDSELNAGRSPIVIGGTHMYIEKLLFTSRIDKDYVPLEPSTEPRDYSFDHLEEIDPTMAKRLHANDVRRWSRAIDYFYDTGNRMSEMLIAQKRELRWKNVIVLEKKVNGPPDVIERRIRDRIEEKMLTNNALKNELVRIKFLVESGRLRWKKGLLQAIGYKEFEEFVTLYLKHDDDGTISNYVYFDKGVEEMVRNTVRYSKKQVKWINKIKSYLEIFAVENFESNITLSLIHAHTSRVKLLPSW